MTDKHRIQTWALYLLPCLFVNIAFAYATAPFGIFLATDSVSYFSVAYHVFSQYSFIQFDGMNHANAAPLYSLILSVPYFLGLDIARFAWWLNLICINIIMFTGYRVIKEAGYKQEAPFIFAALATAYFPFQIVYVFAVSETLFIALLLAVIYFMIKYFNGDNIYKMAIFMSLLCLQRYAALMFLPFMLLFLVKRNYKDTAVFVLIGLLPVSVWFVRNSMQNGNVLGEHRIANKISLIGLQDNVQRAISSLWVQPRQCIATIVVLVLWIVTGYILFKRSRLTWAKCVFSFCSGYMVLLFLQTGILFTEMPRYLTIIWIPCILCMGVCLQHLFSGKGSVVFFGALTLLQGGLIVNKAVVFHRSGAGFTSNEWRDVSVPPIHHNAPLYSNFPAVVWLKAHKTSGFMWYKKDRINPMPDTCTVIWFNQNRMDKLLYTPTELSRYYNVLFVQRINADSVFLLRVKK